MNNAVAFLHHANPIPVDQPWGTGFGGNSLLRTIGLVILAVFGVFQILACFFEILNECFGDQIDDRQAGQIHLPGAGDAPEILGRYGREIEAGQAASPEAERVVQDLAINPKMVAVAPPSVETLAKLLKINDVSKVKIEDMITQFDAIFSVNGAALQKEIDDFWAKKNLELGRLYSPYQLRRAAEKEIAPKVNLLNTRIHIGEYVAFVRNRGGRDRAYTDQLELVAKNISVQLGKPDVPLHKKQTALLELADAIQRCKPRILEESKRQFLSLIGHLLTINDKFLLWAQLLKDNIIIQNFQGDQFHVLNRARKMVGKDWGLDCDPTNLADPHIVGYGGNATVAQYNAVLRANYRPGRLVEAFFNRLAYDDDLRGLYEFLDKNLTEQEKALVDADHADGYIKNIANPSPKDDADKEITVITLKGVAKIAQIVGLLTPKK